MSIKYNVIEIFTSEEARWKGKPVWNSIIDHVRRSGIAVRCIVNRGLAGCYENGEIASNNIESISFNMPLKIEIIFPAAELGALLPGVEEIVTDGIVVVKDMDICVHRTQKRLIPRQLKVKDAMSNSPQTVTEGTSVRTIIEMLLNSEFNVIPVVNQAGQPTGIVTQGDLITRANMPIRLGLLAQFEQGQLEQYLQSIAGKTAREVMTSPVKNIPEDKRLVEAVDLMLTNHLKRLPVVNSEGKLTGILARSDVFHVITRFTPDWQAIKAHKVIVDNITMVSDIMRRDTCKVLPETPIEEVTRIIDENDLQRVAVVDNQGRFLGMIFDSNLLGLFSEHKSAIWDYFLKRESFVDITRKHKELVALGKVKTASDIMKTDVITVHEDTRTEDAIKLMVEKGIKRLPVVDEKGIFKGMISRDALLRTGIR